jgi:hypothetical protein
MDYARLHLVELKRPYSFASPVPGCEFVVWIVATDPSLSCHEMNLIAEALVSEGCRYAVCSGHDCSRWEQAIDGAYLAHCPEFQPQEHNFVMTTCHEDESVAEIARFFSLHTAFDDVAPRHFVVVSIGESQIGHRAIVEACVCLAGRMD